MVRGKVELKPIEDVKKRAVSFSKRCSGLMKKARELSLLCDADVGVMVFSCTGRLHEFASSSMPEIIRRYSRATGPWPLQAQSSLPQQEEEIRSLSEEVMKLRSENMSLLKELEQRRSIGVPAIRGTENLGMALTLRQPSFNADPRRGLTDAAGGQTGM